MRDDIEDEFFDCARSLEDGKKRHAVLVARMKKLSRLGKEFREMERDLAKMKAVLGASSLLLSVLRTLWRVANLEMKPPSSAIYLFYLFMDGHSADALVGDIEERYPRMRQKFGGRKADFWVWSQTIQSLGPVIWAWGKKAAGLTALYDIWKRMMS